jgi:hypothetical protein
MAERMTDERLKELVRTQGWTTCDPAEYREVLDALQRERERVNWLEAWKAAATAWDTARKEGGPRALPKELTDHLVEYPKG